MLSPNRMQNRKIGTHDCIVDVCWKPKSWWPMPFWKTSTIMP